MSSRRNTIIAPQTLQDYRIYSQLLTQNVEQVYEADSCLDYVEIVNHGNASGDSDYYSTVKYKVIVGTEKKTDSSTPIKSGFKLFPTPFTRVVKINCQIPENTMTELTVYDLTGRVIRSLIQGKQNQKGLYTAEWNGLTDNGEVALNGVYFVVLKVDSDVITKSTVFIK